MSQVSFEHLAKQNPKHRRALRELESWVNAHPEDRVLNPLKLRRDIRNVSPAELAVALTLLMRAGLLRRAYKVLTPSGVLTDAEFDDPSAIPDKLPDRFERYFETSDADVVPIFRRTA
jgi:hypothetical protein